MTLQEILDKHPGKTFLSADGLEDAVIGVRGRRLVYSTESCLQILMDRDGMTREDAQEFFDFNIAGGFVGPQTPIFEDD